MDNLIIEYVEYIPKELKPGILYISNKYKTAIHLCPCGCGLETVTPFGNTFGWNLKNENGNVSLQPSLLNKSCNTHYFITDNKIIRC